MTLEELKEATLENYKRIMEALDPLGLINKNRKYNFFLYEDPRTPEEQDKIGWPQY